MNALEQGLAVLRSAEQELRSILARAAEVGDYDHLPRIAEWAKILSAIPGGQTDAEPARLPFQRMVSDRGENGVHERAATPPPAGAASDGARVMARRRRKRRRSRTPEGYPQFVREGESLVKIGWSKSEGKTYEHKAPKGVLRALVKALLRVGVGGGRFTADVLLPLKDSVGGSEIPDYQTYLTLAWLRSTGLITQHGRQGYSLPAGFDLERESERQWGELKTR